MSNHLVVPPIVVDGLTWLHGSHFEADVEPDTGTECCICGEVPGDWSWWLCAENSEVVCDHHPADEFPTFSDEW